LLKREKYKKERLKRGIQGTVQIYREKYALGMLTGIRPAKIVHELMDKGCSKEEINSTLKEYYFVSDKKSEILYNVAKKERYILDNSEQDMVGVYIGIPFCTTRCLYCSFTSNPIKKYEHMVESYIKA